MSTLLTAVLTKLGGEAARTYELNKVPPSPEYPYRVVTVAPADPFARTVAGGSSRFQRIVVQSFGRTLTGALDFDDDATQALDGAFLVAEGFDCGACQLELASAVARDPNDTGVVGVTTTFKLSAPKEA